MKAKLSGKLTWGSIVAAAAIALIPLMVQADGLTKTENDMAAEITSLKKQLHACHSHKKKRVRRHRRSAYVLPVSSKTIVEKQTIIDRPVTVEKIVEKEVFVEKQGDMIIERPMEVQRKVVVEHAKKHKHLLHFGIPFIGVNLF